jgi:hypothetical protein
MMVYQVKLRFISSAPALRQAVRCGEPLKGFGASFRLAVRRCV